MVFMSENYCADCDRIVHQVFDEAEFYAHKVGAIKCPNCGEVIMPCNECDGRGCSECPWRESKVAEALSDQQYVEWVKGNAPETYAMMVKGDMGEYYQGIAKGLKGE